MFDKFGSLTDLMRNLSQIRETVQQSAEALGQVQVEGSAGGGAVTARLNGRLELLSIRIDPKLLADGDHELLEDLVTAAVNQGLAKSREAAAQHLQSMTNLPIPPGLMNPFGG